LRPIRFNRARASGVFTRFPCADFIANPRPANRSPQANPRKVVLHFRALPAPCPPINPCAGAHGYSPGIPSWSFRPLSVLARPATYPAECPIPRLCNPFRFFKPLGALLRVPAVGQFVSPALRSWGFVFRAPARWERLTSRFAYLPSCRYFSALFPSEEWKTTGSSAFRAFFPFRVGMPLVHGRSPELENILAPA
jgi:hypothetical protein